MRRPLTVAVAQPSCIPGDIAANALVHAAVVRASDAHVVVFPELSLSGYELLTPSIDAADPRLLPIFEACAEVGALALIGAPVRGHDGGDYIATIAADGRGVEVAYQKMWLHPPETDRFVPGGKPVVLDVDGWRLGLAICRDSGVPRHAAETAGLGMDAYVASTLFSPAAAARRDERMRAIALTHDVWVVAASLAGPTGGYPSTSGGSGVWAPDATVVAQLGSDVGAVATATLDGRRG